MATPLDLGLLQSFGMIFPMLFIFIVVYAVMIRTEYFKSNKGLASLLGIVLAVMVLFSPIVRETINRMAPWFVLLFIFIIFTLIAFTIFGASEGDIMSVLKSDHYRYVNIWIIALVLIIGIGSLSSVISDEGGFGSSGESITSEAGEGPEQTSDFWNTLVNPKVLGMALIFMIASFTVRYMTQS